ncbi:TetR/AcrR family transcriptional regulator [Jatrophihabitans sp. DSM 45814]
MKSSQQSAIQRTRNRRGEGTKLRDDIVDAATAILERTGREDAVTLRAVARQVGISAPSIYAHFADREAILEAVLDEAFTELIEALTQAIGSVPESDPVRRLRAGCNGYLRFAEERPERYRLLFQSDALTRDLQSSGPVEPPISTEQSKPDPDDFLADHLIGADAFAILVNGITACAVAGRSASTDPFVDATALWVAMHGYASLRARHPDFPWPAYDEIFDRLILGLAKITD